MQWKHVKMTGKGCVFVQVDNADIRVMVCENGSVIVHSLCYHTNQWVPLRSSAKG